MVFTVRVNFKVVNIQGVRNKFVPSRRGNRESKKKHNIYGLSKYKKSSDSNFKDVVSHNFLTVEALF